MQKSNIKKENSKSEIRSTKQNQISKIKMTYQNPKWKIRNTKQINNQGSWV